MSDPFIPQDSDVVTARVTITKFIRPDGTPILAYDTHGDEDMKPIEMLGMLEYAKAMVTEEAFGR